MRVFEIVLSALVLGQFGVIVGLILVIIYRTKEPMRPDIPENPPTLPKSETFSTGLKVLNLPTAEELEEDDRPKGVRDAENAMRNLFKKLSRK